MVAANTRIRARKGALEKMLQSWEEILDVS